MLQFILAALVAITMSHVAVAETAVTPPSSNTYKTVNSTGASIEADWNYIKLDTDKCTVKNVLNELQADGGGALKATDLWILNNKMWENHTFEDPVTIKSKQTVAFKSNTKFYFDLNPEDCTTESDATREEQINQVREVSAKVPTESKKTFTSEIMEKIASVFNFKKDDLEGKETFNTDKAVNIRAALSVIGDTTLWNTVVTGTFKVGPMSLNSLGNSLEINGPNCENSAELCLNQTLYLQRNLAGNVDILDGKVRVLESGNVEVQGTVGANKMVAEEYSVTGESKSVGHGVIKAYTAEVTVESNKIREASKVFVTATSDTKGQALFIKEKREGSGAAGGEGADGGGAGGDVGSFTVAISNSVGNDVGFDWFIINID